MIGWRVVQALFLSGAVALFGAAAAADAATLTVNVSGPATGNVAVSPTGQLCQHVNTSSTTTCSFPITTGMDITVSSSVPFPSTPGIVIGGTGEFGNGACLGSSTCRKSLNSDSTVSFSIDPASPIVTLTINMVAGQPAGLVHTGNNTCPDVCAVNYGVGSGVNLEERSGGSCGDGCVGAGYTNASANASACNGTNTFCSFTINENTSVTALFVGRSQERHDALAMSLRCDPTARRGRPVNVTAEVANHSGRDLTLLRAALGMHVGNVAFVGPLAVNLPALPLVLAASEGEASLPVPVTMPSQARPGTFVSIGLSFFGREGATGARRLLVSDRCAVEIVP